MDAALTREPLPPRPPDNTGAGAMLALAVHIGLVLALAAGVNWRQRPTETFSAEIWAAVPERAAPRAVTPTSTPTPAPAPKPAPPPAAVQPPPPPAPTAADIALEREKERQAAQELERQQAQERQREIERERLAEAKRQREAEAALLKQQRELQRKRQEELARKAEEAKKEAQRKAEEAKRTAALEAQRKENLQRMLGQAGATGAPTSTGTAARDAGPSASYGGRIRASILPNVVLTETLPATLEAEVEVRAAPSGTILARRLVKSSGNATWDEAVLRAIDRTGKLPRDTDGRVPPSLVISFRPE